MQPRNSNRCRLRRSALAVALGLCMSSGAVMAQSTVGSVFGSAEAGATVQIQNLGNGSTRSATVDQDGRYTFSSLQPGNYRVSVAENGQTITRNVQVVGGQGSNVNLVASAQELGAVQVSANTLPAIDVSSVESTTVFTAEQLAKLPVARNQNAVALLAPGASSSDPSLSPIVFNGSSAAENSYYVNGFPVTNQFQSLTYSQLPFEAIGQQEVKSGGYGAKYGYATGGVISVITKRGTNTWEGGARIDWTPESLCGHDPASYLVNGNLVRLRDRNTSDQKTYAAWIGGPLVKDRLFMYALFQQTRTVADTYLGWPNGPTPDGSPGTPAGASHDITKNPYWLVKLDWNINDNNIVEYTGFNDTSNDESAMYYSVYGADAEGHKGDYQGTIYSKTGGETHILKYTGYLTDNFTLTAQYGRLKYARDQYGIDAQGRLEAYDGNVLNLDQPGCPGVIDLRNAVSQGLVQPIQGCSWAGGMNKRGGGDERKEGRLDLEWNVGDHDLRAGYVDDKWTTDTGQQGYEGGVLWYYLSNDAETLSTDPADNYALGILFNTGASVEVDQKSYYLEDYWHITDNFMAYLGVRNDSFENKNGNGETFVSQDNIWQPRLGFSWDVNGDSSFKIYGSAGLYSLPIAATVALRGASASIFEEQFWTYTGVKDDGTGAPILGDKFGTVVINGEAGFAPPAGAVADRDLKPIQQQEFILGFDKQLWSDWTLGVRAMHRTLVNTIDDMCNWTPFYNWAVANGKDADPSGPPSTMPGCWIVNPGRGAKFDIDVDGDGTLDSVTLSKNDIGLPDAKRKYDSIEVSLEKQWNAKWYLRASYVWSHNYGNTEGLVKSDFAGGAQTDTGTTQDFDFPELMVGANGNLPNDRRHTFKLYGAFAPTDEWTIGANLLVQSGRPKNCFGVLPAAEYQQGGVAPYLGGSSFLACHGEVVPRGSLGTMPILWNLDMGVTYEPHWAKGLSLAVNVINVFNKHTPIKRYENAESARHTGPDGSVGPDAYTLRTTYDSTFGQPHDWQIPRYFRFTAEYDFSL
jgi:hypothetical protein